MQKVLRKYGIYVILIRRAKSQRFALSPCLSFLAQNNIPHTHNVGHVHLLITYIHLRNKFHVYSAEATVTKPNAKRNLRTVAMLLLYSFYH